MGTRLARMDEDRSESVVTDWGLALWMGLWVVLLVALIVAGVTVYRRVRG